MRVLIAVMTCLAAGLPAAAQQPKTYRTDHAVVSHPGLSKQYVGAIVKTMEAARAAASKRFGLNVPETVRMKITVDPRGRARLFTDGRDSMFLTIRSEKDLRKPSQSGIFHIYGVCHELGHMTMYRVIRDRSWMTTAAAEGWAHYLGSRIVDAIHAAEGADLWPDKYDYLADGTKRLDGQLAAKPSPVASGAGLWKRLVAIVGDKGVAPIFAAWGKAKVDPADPGAALRKALLTANPDERLGQWWNEAEPVLTLRRPKSDFAVRTATPAEMSNRPDELSRDDGIKAGRGSIAGGGHGVKFEVNGAGWYLSAVKVHGERYGRPRPPAEGFHVWLCDKDYKAIADFRFPYARFTRGAPRWVLLRLAKPVAVPPEFAICAGFNPTQTKGVYVSHDKRGGGHSLTGLPGRQPRPFGRGDWMIRAVVDRLKVSDALRPSK